MVKAEGEIGRQARGREPGRLRMDGNGWHETVEGGEDGHLLPGRDGKDEWRQPLILSPYARTGVWLMTAV